MLAPPAASSTPPARARGLFWGLLPIAVVVAIFVAVLRLGQPVPFPRRALPVEPFQGDRCTWTCHNHGCRHVPRLPPWLSGDEGLFGQTVHGLHWLGRLAMPHNPRQGYGLVNLVIFCVLWPALMWGLYLKALAQRRRLAELSRQRQTRQPQPGSPATDGRAA